jgi:hypothetical protein
MDYLRRASAYDQRKRTRKFIGRSGGSKAVSGLGVRLEKVEVDLVSLLHARPSSWRLLLSDHTAIISWMCFLINKDKDRLVVLIWSATIHI